MPEVDQTVIDSLQWIDPLALESTGGEGMGGGAVCAAVQLHLTK